MKKTYTQSEIHSYLDAKDKIEKMLSEAESKVSKIRTKYGYTSPLVSYEEMGNQEFKEEVKAFRHDSALMFRQLQLFNKSHTKIGQYVHLTMRQIRMKLLKTGVRIDPYDYSGMKQYFK